MLCLTGPRAPCMQERDCHQRTRLPDLPQVHLPYASLRLLHALPAAPLVDAGSVATYHTVDCAMVPCLFSMGL